ncbi:DUF4390 domain-containing protein [Gammaproteobacteria bacterium]
MTANRWLGFLLLWLPSIADTSGFDVQVAYSTLVNSVYQLHARLSLDLGEEATKALRSGIPLTLVLDVELGRKRHHLPWKENITSRSKRYRLEYYSLTEQYRVTYLDTGVQGVHSTLDLALRAISTLNGIPLVEQRKLLHQERYEIDLRIRLDVEALPAPLRVLAYFSSGWRVISPWYSFPLILK